MSSEKPELENAIRIAIEAADAANSAAADVAEMRRQYHSAAEEFKTQRKHYALLTAGVIGSVVIAAGISAFMFFKTTSSMEQSNAMQMEALGVFTQSVGELRTSLLEIDKVTQSLGDNSGAQAEALTLIKAQMDEMESQVAAMGSTFNETMGMISSEASALQPQLMSAVQQNMQASVDDLRIETTKNFSDLQVALSK